MKFEAYVFALLSLLVDTKMFSLSSLKYYSMFIVSCDASNIAAYVIILI